MNDSEVGLPLQERVAQRAVRHRQDVSLGAAYLRLPPPGIGRLLRLAITLRLHQLRPLDERVRHRVAGHALHAPRHLPVVGAEFSRRLAPPVERAVQRLVRDGGEEPPGERRLGLPVDFRAHRSSPLAKRRRRRVSRQTLRRASHHRALASSLARARHPPVERSREGESSRARENVRRAANAPPRLARRRRPRRERASKVPANEREEKPFAPRHALAPALRLSQRVLAPALGSVAPLEKRLRDASSRHLRDDAREEASKATSSRALVRPRVQRARGSPISEPRDARAKFSTVSRARRRPLAPRGERASRESMSRGESESRARPRDPIVAAAKRARGATVRVSLRRRRRRPPAKRARQIAPKHASNRAIRQAIDAAGSGCVFAPRGERAEERSPRDGGNAPRRSSRSAFPRARLSRRVQPLVKRRRPGATRHLRQRAAHQHALAADGCRGFGPPRERSRERSSQETRRASRRGASKARRSRRVVAPRGEISTRAAFRARAFETTRAVTLRRGEAFRAILAILGFARGGGGGVFAVAPNREEIRPIVKRAREESPRDAL